MKRLEFLVLLLLSPVAAASADPVLLGSYHCRWGHVAFPSPPSYLSFALWYGVHDADWEKPAGVNALFAIDSNTTPPGTTHVFHSGVAYDSAVALMTDGVDNYGGFVWRLFKEPVRVFGGTGDDTEAEFWLAPWDFPKPGWAIDKYYAGLNGADFRGFEITHLSLSLAAWDDFEFTFSVFGNFLFEPGPAIPDVPVPEPASPLLLGTGLVGLRAWRRRCG